MSSEISGERNSKKITSMKNDTEAIKSDFNAIQNSKKRLLIMDDDPVIQIVVQKILKKIGYSAECANSGQEAFQMFKDAHQNGTPYRLVLMDLTIHGGMGGVETVKLIRSVDKTVSVVAFSGYSSDPVIQEYWKYGFDGVLKKPFSYNDFIELFKSIPNNL